MGHEHERLSAYLDDELPSTERAQVAAHVQTCPECAERLAALGAVDEAVAALPAEAPAGYFEALPGRVRARLDARPKRTRLPAWTWAVAAVLALAVVTPLTLRQQPQQDRGPAPALETRAAPAAAPPPVPSPAAPPATLQALRDEQKEQGAREKDNAHAQNRYDEALKREGGFVPAPTDRNARLEAAPPAAPERRVQTTAPQPSVQAADAASPKTREEEAVAATETLSESLDAVRQPPGAMAEPKRDATAEAAAGTTSRDAGSARGRVVRQAPSGTAAAKLLSFESEWQRLEARRPRTAAEWRRLREDWRGFVARDPEGPLADPARLRMIEAGRAVWRESQDAADEATFHLDAEAYLARDAAQQKDRVRQMLADPAAR
jgi:hypothetical protein